MTTQPDDAHTPADPAAKTKDPIGPITPPKRSKLGARALALVGTASLAAVVTHSVLDSSGTFTTIQD